jgi:hypothetical protein
MLCDISFNDVRRWLELATGDAAEAAASLQSDDLNTRISSTLTFWHRSFTFKF